MTTWLSEPGSERPHHGRVVFGAVVYTSLAVGCWALTALAAYKIATGFGGFVVMLSVFGLFALLATFWARHFLRDLNADLVTIEAELAKKWHKGNFLIFFLPSYYLLVGDKIYTVKAREYAMLLETDRVRLTCYPYSLTVARIERFDTSTKKYVPADDGAID